MDFHRILGSPQLTCNLLIELAGNDHADYFLFTSTQGTEAFLNLTDVSFLFASVLIPLQGYADGIKAYFAKYPVS